jgi:hypothetical protein
MSFSSSDTRYDRAKIYKRLLNLHKDRRLPFCRVRETLSVALVVEPAVKVLDRTEIILPSGDTALVWLKIFVFFLVSR